MSFVLRKYDIDFEYQDINYIQQIKKIFGQLLKSIQYQKRCMKKAEIKEKNNCKY